MSAEIEILYDLDAAAVFVKRARRRLAEDPLAYGKQNEKIKEHVDRIEDWLEKTVDNCDGRIA